jgi:hypothetical protein
MGAGAPSRQSGADPVSRCSKVNEYTYGHLQAEQVECLGI